jgi:hypothetical protein
VAAPISLFFSPAHAAALDAVRKQFPKLHVFDATREFASTADWLRRWPDLLPRINTLVVVPRPDGSVNGSCAREVLDFCAQQTYGVSAESSPPGLTRVAAVPRLFVFEAGSLKRIRRFSLAPNGTVSRMAFVGAMQPAHSSEAVWQ